MRFLTDERIRIGSAALTAEISPRGAELMSLRAADGEEYLWQGDPSIWADRSPILFPVVGRLAGDVLRVDGRDCPMPIHGFARAMKFAVAQLSDSSAMFSVRATEATLASYPWDFGLDVHYTITGATLAISLAVSNHSDRPMPFMLGLHPGFRWPLSAAAPRESHYLEFEHDESIDMEIGRNGFRGTERRAVGLLNRRLPLSDELFNRGAAIFPAPLSHSVRFATADPAPFIKLDFSGFEHLALWTRPGASYLCIEPWQTLPHAEHAPPDLAHAPMLRRGESANYVASVTIGCDVSVRDAGPRLAE